MKSISFAIGDKFIIRCGDYHDFEEAKDFFKQIGLRTKFVEQDTDDGDYMAEFEITGIFDAKIDQSYYEGKPTILDSDY